VSAVGVQGGSDGGAGIRSEGPRVSQTNLTHSPRPTRLCRIQIASCCEHRAVGCVDSTAYPGDPSIFHAHHRSRPARRLRRGRSMVSWARVLVFVFLVSFTVSALPSLLVLEELEEGYVGSSSGSGGGGGGSGGGRHPLPRPSAMLLRHSSLPPRDKQGADRARRRRVSKQTEVVLLSRQSGIVQRQLLPDVAAAPQQTNPWATARTPGCG
jgi:hypothetical protein